VENQSGTVEEHHRRARGIVYFNHSTFCASRPARAIMREIVADPVVEVPRRPVMPRPGAARLRYIVGTACHQVLHEHAPLYQPPTHTRSEAVA